MSPDTTRPEVLVTGATTADFYFERVVDGDVGPDVQWVPGGVGTSVARALALLDEPPYLATRLGDDSFARAIARELEDHDVPQTLVTETTADTPLLFSVPEAAGGPRWETRLEASSFGFELPEEAESLFDHLAILHLTGTTLPPDSSLDAMRTAIDYARANDVDVSFDMNCRPNQWSDLSRYTDLATEMLGAADVVFASREDLRLAGFDDGVGGLFDGFPDRATVTAFLTAAGDGATAIRLDDGGVTARHSHRGFDVDVVDPAAGGDAFASAVLAGRTQGVTDLETLVELGNAAGAAAVTSMGPFRPGDVETFRSLSGGVPDS
ncbi:MAG: sugar/nucleoside kinase (ribokinase family) [Halobacteriales archaeon]|jgi:sugar/nucleoside kinase (ribokinase family)